MDEEMRRGSTQTASSGQPKKPKSDHCAFGLFHLHTGMKVLVIIGCIVLLALLTVLFMRFKKAIFILLIPTFVTVFTIAAILLRAQKLIWPIIAISFFHVILALYAGLIFAFYFTFKPFYIIMVLNWAFDTLHTDKTPSYYVHCACIALIIIVFGTFNAWQAATSVRYMDFLGRSAQSMIVPMSMSVEDSASMGGRQHMVLVVNKSVDYRAAAAEY